MNINTGSEFSATINFEEVHEYDDSDEIASVGMNISNESLLKRIQKSLQNTEDFFMNDIVIFNETQETTIKDNFKNKLDCESNGESPLECSTKVKDDESDSHNCIQEFSLLTKPKSSLNPQESNCNSDLEEEKDPISISIPLDSEENGSRWGREQDKRAFKILNEYLSNESIPLDAYFSTSSPTFDSILDEIKLQCNWMRRSKDLYDRLKRVYLKSKRLSVRQMKLLKKLVRQQMEIDAQRFSDILNEFPGLSNIQLQKHIETIKNKKTKGK